MPRVTRRSVALPLASACLVAAVASALAACSWSVPADPGLNARLRSRPDPLVETPPPAADLLIDPEDVRATYLVRCGRCHEPPSPRSASRDEWPGILRKMAPRAGLYGEDRDRVLRWLTANSR